MTNGFRKGKENEHLSKMVDEGTINKWEYDQILRQREASMVDPKSKEYEIILASDDLRKKRNMVKKNVEEYFHDIESIKLYTRRKRVEIESGEITTKLAQGDVMTPEELELEIRRHEHKAWVMSRKILEELSELRAIVGHTDAGKNIVMSNKEYEEYATKIAKRLEKFGYGLYE